MTTPVFIDARPLLTRQADTIWAKAERVRDQIFDALQQVCKAEGIQALVIKSNPFYYPVWVKIECWLPAAGNSSLTERGSAVVTIQPQPYHRYELEYQLTYEHAFKTRKVNRLSQFTRDDASTLVKYLLDRGPRPHYALLQLRATPWQIWRSKNTPTLTRRDIRTFLAWGTLIIGVIALQAGTVIAALFGLFLLVGSLIYLWHLSRRPILALCPGKPMGEPRSLAWVDSWQTVIFGMGDEQRTVLDKFLKRLVNGPAENFRHHIERIWYWGLDGTEEREQIVLTLNRGIFFCHIHKYGRELYIGWDAHLNNGQWVEKKVTDGIHVTTGDLVRTNTVVPGTQPITEYDINDLNCLIEWTHGQLVQLLKEFMAEKKIDQEVDFKILRGDRQTLTGRREESRRREEPRAAPMIGRFRRAE